MRDIEIIQRELPIDLLEPHCLTPLPGSEDHQKLHKAGAYLDPDLNKYDLEHVTTTHSTMSPEQWQKLYHDSWAAFYSPEHLKTVMRRSVATASNAGNMTFLLLWYYAMVALEKIDPLEGGYLRRKYRKDRRPTLPVESPVDVLSALRFRSAVQAHQAGQPCLALRRFPPPTKARSRRPQLHRHRSDSGG